uniref:Dopamine receptor 1 n=1 Tax=Gryllus bimaculatus TaxID=6999 RepID=I2FKE9_GRYBI|nr:dopamine receptor 1 [Gryllus bimaculatus]
MEDDDYQVNGSSASAGPSGGAEGASADSNDEDDLLSTPSVLVVGALLSLLIFLSIAGNVLVCVAIYTERGLRRIGNLFLASLAVADLFVAALVMTFAVANDLLGHWLFGEALCDTWIAFDVMCSTASILNLCAISLDRYIHIKDPLRYGRWVTRRVALGSIAVVWLLAALVSFVPISLGLHRPSDGQPPPAARGPRGEELPTCALDLAPVYAVVSSCVSFYCPTLVMLGIYCRLYLYAQKHVKNIRAVTRPLSANFDGAGASPSHKVPLSQAQSSPYHVSDHKAAITVGVIMGVFLVCWVPFFCVNIIAAFCKTCIPGIAFKVLTWLGYSNSAFNPIIYSIFNKEFRDAFRRILTANAAYVPCCSCCPAKCGYEAVSSRSSLAAQGQRRSKASVDCGALGGGMGAGAGGQRRGNGACAADAVTPRSSAGSAAAAAVPTAVHASKPPPPPQSPAQPQPPPSPPQPRLAETRVDSTEQDPEEEVSAI